MITADLLTRVPLFANIPENERASLAARAADVRVKADEWLLLEGQTPAFYALLEGRLSVFKEFAGRDEKLLEYAPGDYFGEVPLLLGSPTIASIRAIEPSRVMRLEPGDFHEIIAHCRVLSVEIMKTMARRVNMLQQRVAETPVTAATLIGRKNDTVCHDLREFLSRNRVPFTWLDVDDPHCLRDIRKDQLMTDDELERLDRGGPPLLPLVVLTDGRRLECPPFRDLAEALGFQTAPTREMYDVVVIGGGPAGLAAAVYGASEGLCTLLVERVACGGQAGRSSRIENYLGFPAGLSGDELSGRARQQALRFGAELLVARSAVAVEPGEIHGGLATPTTVVLDNGDRVQTGSVILATGVQWRRLAVPGIQQLEGHGVYYGAARTEALGVRGRTVHLVGGGNSAGQAAMLFSSYAESVTMLVRGPSLAASMSQYLITQLASKDNISVETEVEVVGVVGDAALEAIDVVCGPERRRERRQSDGLFVFIGAAAETSWLPETLIRDQWGYVCTGRDVMDLLHDQTTTTWPLTRDPYLLETSVPGIFAAGDVRHGSIKRVASGVGEGSMAIAFVHQHLAELHRGSLAAT